MPDPRGGAARARRRRAGRRAACRFVVGAAAAASTAEFVFLCVPTPQGDDGAADLVDRRGGRARDRAGPAARRGGRQQVDGARRVDRARASACSPRAARSAGTIGVASNPEFLREGSAVRDFLAARPRRDRLRDTDGRGPGVASSTAACRRRSLVTDPASAEMIKYASNAFLATKISFINAIANLCEPVDADVREVALGMGYDPRIGFEFLHAGPGLRRLLLPEGHRGAAATPPQAAGYDFELLRRRHRRQPAPARADGREDRATPPAARSTGRASPCGASRSRPTPTTCATRRRSRSSRRLIDARRARSAPTTRPRASGPPALVPGLEVVSDPYDACDGRRRARRPHRVGRVPLARLRAGRATSMRAADDRRRPQPARPGRDAPRSASRTRASVADAAGGRHRRRRLPRLAPLPRRCSSAAGDGRRGRQPAHRAAATTSTTCAPIDGFAFVEHDVTEERRTSTGRSTRCCTSPARRARRDYLEYPIKTLEGRVARHPQHARPARSRPARASCSRRRARSTATRSCTRSPRTTGATSTRSGPRGVYDEAKRFAEAMTMAYHRAHGRRRQDRPHLQHLRPAPAARRRARGVELPRAGARRQAAHDLRRRRARPGRSATSTTRCAGSSALLDSDCDRAR